MSTGWNYITASFGFFMDHKCLPSKASALQLLRIKHQIFFTLYKNIEDIFWDHLDVRVHLL